MTAPETESTTGTLPERVLMGPGPSNPFPSVIEAMTRPVLGHLDPKFLEILDETNELLRRAFRTNNRLTFPVSGTGSAGMEAAFCNFIAPGDAVVVGVNGVFGMRMCDVAERVGAEVIRVDAPWGEPVDIEALLGAHANPKIIALVHAETSTGVRSDLGDLGKRKGDALVVLDCVTSLGGIPVEIDEWGVDIAYSGTQKCLGVPPGLAPLTVSDRALEQIEKRPSSWYLDLNMIADYVNAKGARAYHHTAPISMIYALHAGLQELMAEGLEASFQRHAAVGRDLRQRLGALGFEMFVKDDHYLPELTTVWVPEERLPDGQSEADVRRTLLDRYQIEIGGGLGEFAGKIWRIGLMGHTARPENVTKLVDALQEILV